MNNSHASQCPPNFPTQSQSIAASQYLQSCDKFRPHPVYWESMEKLRTVKALMIGNGGVGKSCIARAFKALPFSPDYRPSKGVEFVHRDYADNLRFQIWDMPGDDRFMKIAASYFRSCHVFIIVFDVNNRSSFDAIRNIEQYMDKESKDYKTVLVVGNKNDLGKRAVSEEEAQAFCEEKEYLYLDISCKADEQGKIQNRLDELLYTHLALSLPINNFSDDNYARNLYGNLYHFILSKLKVIPRRNPGVDPQAWAQPAESK